MDPSVPRVPKIQSRWSECDNEAERSWKGCVYFSLLIEYLVTYRRFLSVPCQCSAKVQEEFKVQRPRGRPGKKQRWPLSDQRNWAICTRTRRMKLFCFVYYSSLLLFLQPFKQTWLIKSTILFNIENVTFFTYYHFIDSFS